MMEEQKGDRHFEIYAQTALEQNHLDRAITTATAISNYIQEMNNDVDALLANNAGDAGAEEQLQNMIDVLDEMAGQITEAREQLRAW